MSDSRTIHLPLSNFSLNGTILWCWFFLTTKNILGTFLRLGDTFRLQHKTNPGVRCHLSFLNSSLQIFDHLLLLDNVHLIFAKENHLTARLRESFFLLDFQKVLRIQNRLFLLLFLFFLFLLLLHFLLHQEIFEYFLNIFGNFRL